MSEVDSRPTPSRGRSSVRGGRGGFGRGGPRGGHRQTNGGAAKEQAEPSLDDQGEIGELRKQYGSNLLMLKDMFPDWTDVDLVFALQETDGDLQTTIEKITEGHISQFSEIRKPKDRARSKAKDAISTEHVGTARGGRGRGGIEGSRGGRGRGDRARGVSRGGRLGAGAPAVKDVSEENTTGAAPDSNAWDQAGSNETQEAAHGDTKAHRGNVVAAEPTHNTASEATRPSLLQDGPAKKTWASMFNLPRVVPAPAASASAKQQKSVPPSDPVASEHTASAEPIQALEEPTVAPAHEESPALPQIETPTASAEVLEAPHDKLTEHNLEHLPDTSIPPATQTVASTIGSDAPGKATPLGAGSQLPIGRPGVGGYASTAMRATGMTPRSASYQRRVMEQQEAVVLPGHNSIDRATVQFGSMGLNGDAADVDEEREEPETRTQPQQSPPGQPRASLPPAAISAGAPSQDSYTGQGMPTPKAAPGLPPANPQQGQQQQYGQYARYGQQDMHAPSQKSYDPFSHQTPSGYDQYSSHNQGQSQQQDYSQYYGSEQQRNAYQNYYGGSYGQHQGQSQQESASSQQRAGNAVGSGQGESGYGATQGAQQSQGRYNEPQGSGHNTPAPATNNQQSGAPGQQAQQQPQQQQQQQQHQPQQQQQQSQYGGAGYPYGHPYYNSPYAAAYQNQFGYTGYGGAPYGKQGGGGGAMYNQPQGYGINAPSSYEHGSSPANSSFNQQSAAAHSRDTAHSSGVSEYNRSSTQPSSIASGGFGGVSDYGRSQSGYQGQGHAYGSQQTGGSDDLKSLGDSKGAAGPSPGLSQPGRPSSATNNAAGQGQPGLPPPQGHQQQGYGQYPGFNQGSQYGSQLGGLGGHQGGQQGGYGGYSGFSQSYNQYGRGGWGASYGH
ncbi:hypothetical protein ANO11243_086250 [Dothideomycetidae sp. 11243]|nr:hypothetical protein ANO11243_086250 [fungal sp. No.11243]